MTPSEKYVSDLCKQSFLPFWSFPNPLGKNDKELCDVLVVCDKHVIIISVKDITVSNHRDENVKYDRWVSRAVYDSVKQIIGAERYLASVDEVLLSDRRTKIKLPPKNQRVIYRIAVAFGSKPNFPLPFGDFEEGFVNVFDEESTFVLLDELDTITDFTDYLRAKEKVIMNNMIMADSEVDFLAFYLQNGFDFDPRVNAINLDSGLWSAYTKSTGYLQWQKDIEGSFVWDELISTLHKYHVTNEITNSRFSDLETAIRHINLEPRINRIELGSVLRNFFEVKARARMIPPLKGTNHLYVFLRVSKKNWSTKEKELSMRCLVARVENSDAHNVIGISFGKNQNNEAFFDFCFLHDPELNDQTIQLARDIQKEFGYFAKPVVSHSKDFRNKAYKSKRTLK